MILSMRARIWTAVLLLGTIALVFGMFWPPKHRKVDRASVLRVSASSLLTPQLNLDESYRDATGVYILPGSEVDTLVSLFNAGGKTGRITEEGRVYSFSIGIWAAPRRVIRLELGRDAGWVVVTSIWHTRWPPHDDVYAPVSQYEMYSPGLFQYLERIAGYSE